MQASGNVEAFSNASNGEAFSNASNAEASSKASKAEALSKASKASLMKEESKQKLRQRHEAIRAQLQGLYSGRAREYETPCRENGQLYPPHGTCYTDVLLQLMQPCVDEMAKQESLIKDLEERLLACPLALVAPHPMIQMQPGVARCAKREDLIMEIAKAGARRRIAHDTWTALNAVKPASNAYMTELASLFKEKREVLVQLLEEHREALEEW